MAQGWVSGFLQRQQLTRGCRLELGKRLISDALDGLSPEAQDELVQHLLTFAFGLRAAPTTATMATARIEVVPPEAMDAFAAAHWGSAAA